MDVEQQGARMKHNRIMDTSYQVANRKDISSPAALIPQNHTCINNNVDSSDATEDATPQSSKANLH